MSAHSREVRLPPRVWALVSSVVGVVALIGGWLIAQAVQPPGYDPVTQTISALARHGLDHRWIMTTGLALLGAAHVVTAAGLRPLRPASRVVLAVAGVSTIGVSIFAQPLHGTSTIHIVLATIGFVLLAVWPATTMTRTTMMRTTIRRGPAAVIAPPLAIAATVVSVGLLIWVGATQSSGPLGLSERLLTADQALWPLVVVVGLLRATRWPTTSAARLNP